MSVSVLQGNGSSYVFTYEAYSASSFVWSQVKDLVLEESLEEQ